MPSEPELRLSRLVGYRLGRSDAVWDARHAEELTDPAALALRAERALQFLRARSITVRSESAFLWAYRRTYRFWVPRVIAEQVVRGHRPRPAALPFLSARAAAPVYRRAAGSVPQEAA